MDNKMEKKQGFEIIYPPIGSVKISDAAMSLALRLQTTLKEQFQRSDMIIGFGWSTQRQFVDPNGRKTLDLGAGIDLVAYEPDQIPTEAVIHESQLRYVVVIPSSVLAGMKMPCIVPDPAYPSGLMLVDGS